MNGVKIAVPVTKMSIEDLEYVERMTGISLDEDKPLSDIKKKQQRQRDSTPSSTAGASIERPRKPEYDWFQFFLACDVAVGLCERYSQAFQKDSMDESVLPDIDSTVLRNLGIREGDIIKCMRFLDKKFARTGKRNVSFGGEEVMGDGDGGGLFSGPGGTLRNNTRKGRPAPTVQTSDTVDAKAFSQEPKAKPVPEGVATPIANAPVPIQKDVVRSGFDDDAWDVKPSRQTPQPTATQQPQPTPAPAPVPQQPALTAGMQELSLLSQPLEPIRVQPTAPPQPTPQPQSQVQPQPQQGPPAVTPSFFGGIGNQQTGMPQQQISQLNIARQRPQPPQFHTQQGSLLIPAPPNRPLSAPLAPQQNLFSVPPLQPQITGMQNSAGYQTNIAPPGQSMDELRMRQQFTAYNGMQNGQNMGAMNTGQPFTNQFNNGPQNGFQYSMATGIPQQQMAQQIPQQQMPQQTNFMNNGAGPFADPRNQQFSPLQPNPTGFQSSFGPPQQQFPQPTGINAFLPPALQPQITGMPSQQQNGFNSSFPPPMPPMPQQHTTPAPLLPQKTGPPPPVRFGTTNKIMPQPTGRRANLSQASKYIPNNYFRLYEF